MQVKELDAYFRKTYFLIGAPKQIKDFGFQQFLRIRDIEATAADINQASLVYSLARSWDVRWAEALKIIKDGDVVLDYGCGSGDILIELKKRKKIRAVGIDILETVKDIEYYRLPDRIPLEDDSVDVVLLLVSMHHIKNIDSVMNDVSRVCKPNALILVKEHNVRNDIEFARCQALHKIKNDAMSPVIGYFDIDMMSRTLPMTDVWEEDQSVVYGTKKMVTKTFNGGLAPVILVNRERGTRSSRVQALLQYIAEMNSPRFNKYLVYAFPGSGKSTWVNKVLKTVGYKAIDTDDFLKIFEHLSDIRKFHELAFCVSSTFNANTPNIVVTNFHSELFLAYMRKLGFTLCAVKLEDAEWKKRFSERADLKEMSAPWAKWRKEVDYGQFDIVVSDFHELNDLVYTPTQIVGYMDPLNGLNYKHAQRPIPILSDDGHYVRKSVLLWLQREKLKYVGLGDEIEAVLDSYDIQKQSRADFDLRSETLDTIHYGLPASQPADEIGKIAMGMIRRSNLFDVDIAEGEVGVSLWAISNTINPEPIKALKMLAKKGGKYVLMYPILNVARTHPYGLGGDYVDGKRLFSVRGDRVYSDWVADFSEFMKVENFVSMNLLDFLAYINHDIEGKYVGPSGRFFASRTSYRNQLWGIVMSKELMRFPEFQTWWNSQTHTVRLISVPIRRELAVGSQSLYQFRRLVSKIMYPDCITVQDERVTCYRLVNGKKYWIAVSGHMANLLMFSSVNHVDFVRYLDCIEENVRIYTTKGRISSSLKMLLGKELLAEDNEAANIRRLWHSYPEFQLGVATYVMMAKSLRLPFNPRAVAYIMRRLNAIKRKYPEFSDMGWQPKERALVDP